MALLSGARLPQVSVGLNRMGDSPLAGAFSNTQGGKSQVNSRITNNTFNLNVSTASSAQDVMNEFEFMSIMGVT